MENTIIEIRFVRDTSHNGQTKWINKQLKHGRKLKQKISEHNTDHIPCKIQYSTEKIDTPNTPNWQDIDAIIPNDGIDDNGYVKEVWVECFEAIDVITVELFGQSHIIIDPFIHTHELWIQGFKTKGKEHIDLLPSPEIIVKYSIAKSIE